VLSSLRISSPNPSLILAAGNSHIAASLFFAAAIVSDGSVERNTV